MKVWAYINPQTNILCCALLKESVPSNVNAVELEVETPDDVVYIDGVIRVKTTEEKLSEAKQKAIQNLYTQAYTYTFRYYNDMLLRTDLINREVGENYLVYKGIDTNTFRKDVSSYILSNKDYQTAVSDLNQKYNSNNEPMVSFWISTLLAIAYRHYFAYLVSQEYTSYIQQIQQASSLPLPDFEFKTPFPQL
jgi:hypothetical protein